MKWSDVHIPALTKLMASYLEDWPCAQEEKPESRPKCNYKVTDPTGRTPCGSEDNLHTVKGTSPYGKSKETIVCGKHRLDAHRVWNYDSIEPWKPK